MHWSATSFVTDDAPHFKEYLSLIGNPSPFASIDPIGPDDALVIIDMQNDFLLRDAATNPDGGRFGAPEGDQCIAPIVRMIEHFVERGGHVIATRDYHPYDHASFYTEGGPYPPHCVQGTVGAELVPEIAEALAQGIKAAGGERVSVCFKGMHEHVDSFGALPYFAGGDHVAPRNAGGAGLEEAGLPRGCTVGCCAAPWSGSLFLKQSAISGPLAAKADFGAVNMNAPPDLCALLDDGLGRPVANLQDTLKPRKRIFVCGLCLDVCVLDTCVNAAACGFRDATYMVLDACRAAHVHGLGTFGSGFLYEPAKVQQKMEGAALRLASVAAVVGHSPPTVPPSLSGGKAQAWAQPQPQPKPKARAFPDALAPFGLEAASCAVLVSNGCYSMARRVDATLQDPTLRAVGHLFADDGTTSPSCPLPSGWPGAPAAAATLCWANPLPKASDMNGAVHGQSEPAEFGCLMGASTSPELNFVAYGGFLLLDRHGAVVAVQSLCAPKAGGAVLRFGSPRRWRPEFIDGVEPRLQAITLPALLRAGATSFCWLHPREVIASGPEEWTPSVSGAFLYQLGDGAAVYFPLEPAAAARTGAAVPARWMAAAAAVSLAALVAAKAR